MNETPPSARYARAFETLGVAPPLDAAELKRAYRRAVAAHPPDRDAEGFRRVREAYELLSAPEDVLRLLVSTRPTVPAPALLAPPAVDLARALPLAALRHLATQLDARALLGDDGDGR